LTVTAPVFESRRIHLTGIDVFDAQTFVLNERGDQANAIDGNLSTFSYLTPGGTTTPQIVAVDFGTGLPVNRIRVAKEGDIDGIPAASFDNMNLRILYTTNSGPLNTRTYLPVPNLTNGFMGADLLSADAVNADGSVVKDHHDYATQGFYSLTFQEVAATGVAIQFERDAGDPAPFTHYPAHEFEAYDVIEGGPSLEAAISAGAIVISWTASTTEFTLQTTDKLPATTWSTVTNSPVMVGGLNQVTLPINGAAAFYRLRK